MLTKMLLLTLTLCHYADRRLAGRPLAKKAALLHVFLDGRVLLGQEQIDPQSAEE